MVFSLLFSFAFIWLYIRCSLLNNISSLQETPSCDLISWLAVTSGEDFFVSIHYHMFSHSSWHRRSYDARYFQASFEFPGLLYCALHLTVAPRHQYKLLSRIECSFLKAQTDCLVETIVHFQFQIVHQTKLFFVKNQDIKSLCSS